VTVLLLHGAWQGSWAWEQLLPHFREAGLDALAPDLPGNGADDTAAADVSLDLYVDSMMRRIDSMNGKVSLVAHSGAGIIASQVAETCPDRVDRIVYVTGMMLPSGVSFAEVVAPFIEIEPSATGIGPHLIWSNDRLTSQVPVEAAQRIFYHDCRPDLAAAAARRLTPQPERGRAVRARLSPERFGRVPRFYVEALADRSIVPSVQRQMQALVPGAKVAALPTGHAPQLAAPKALAEYLIPWLRDPL
jgi:pimeloyl-ACP methyl ester carboxylesterase